jgi:hypothetical protein
MLVAALLLVSCSSTEDLGIVHSQITHFRERMAAERFDQIYADAGDELKKATSEKQFTDFLSAVDRKLGGVKDAKDSGWNINFRPTATLVTLSQKTEFERGSGVEAFVYRIAGKQAKLLGYHLSSNDLIVN